MDTKLTELNGLSANDIIRYGRIDCLLDNDNGRYYIIYLKRKYYEIEISNGKLDGIKIYKIPPKYYKQQVSSKYNKAINNERINKKIQ